MSIYFCTLTYNGCSQYEFLSKCLTPFKNNWRCLWQHRGTLISLSPTVVTLHSISTNLLCMGIKLLSGWKTLVVKRKSSVGNKDFLLVSWVRLLPHLTFLCLPQIGDLWRWIYQMIKNLKSVYKRNQHALVGIIPSCSWYSISLTVDSM